MGTVGESLIKNLKRLYEKYDQIGDEIDETISDLCGSEINFKNYDYCMVEHIDDTSVLLFCENNETDGDGENTYDVVITLDELQELLS